MNKIIQRILNLKNIQWIALISVFIFLLAEIAYHILILPWYYRYGWPLLTRIAIQLSKLVNHEIVWSFAPTVSSFALIIAIFASLIAGGFLIRDRINLKRGIVLVALGILLGTYCIAKPIAHYLYFCNFVEETRKSVAEDLENMRCRLESEKNISERVELGWRTYAKLIFQHTGKRIDFPTQSGDNERYNPTDMDYQMRAIDRNIEAILQPPYISIILRSFIFFIGIVIAILLPLIFK